MARRRALIALLLVLPCACAHPPAARRMSDIGGETLPGPPGPGRRSPDSEPPQLPPPGGAALSAAAVWRRSERTLHRRLAGEAEPELVAAEAEAPAPKPAATGGAAGAPGGAPGDGAPAGDPQARRPDRLSALPTTGQPRYFSPKELSRQRRGLGADAAAGRTPPPREEPSDAELSDARAKFAPPRTAPLQDSVPDVMVADPTALGSYHVQVARRADFGAIVLDKVYPFMADIDMEGELAGSGAKAGVYWIRYSIVDLLEFEHPFTTPRRLRYAGSVIPR